MKVILDEMLAALSRGERVVLCSILASSGSVPRGAGAKMAVLEDGRVLGTIGGGAVERQSVLLARELLKGKRNALRDFALHPEAANSTGMVCGGDVTAHFQFIPAEDPLWNDTASRALALLEQHTAGWLVLLVMVLLTIPALVRGKLSRVQGVALLCIYAAFCAVQFTM